MTGSLDLLLGNVRKCYLLNSVDYVCQLTHLNPDLEFDSLTYTVTTLRSQSVVIFLPRVLLIVGEKAFITLSNF